MKAVNDAHDADVDDLQCKVCGAHATGFHFGAQSCSACCAFFRRAISLKRVYACERECGGAPNLHSCIIVYTERKLCRACRLRKCFAVGMKTSCVQDPKRHIKRIRAYCTSSGLRRNKRFSVISNVAHTVWRREYGANTIIMHQGQDPDESIRRETGDIVIHDGINDMNAFMPRENVDEEIESKMIRRRWPKPGVEIAASENEFLLAKPVPIRTSPAESTTSISFVDHYNDTDHDDDDVTNDASLKCVDPGGGLSPNLLAIFIQEEMRIAERRRILFCERPVSSLLGNTMKGPYTINDIRPLDFYEFHSSVRVHILLTYEWLRVCPHYARLCKQDQLTFLRKSVLYHTILDPCFITLQVGDLSKFVLQNGGFISTITDDGWQDEHEISRDNKKKIYWPLLKRFMSDIIAQMVALNLDFEEFVAIKALISIQMTLFDASKAGRSILKEASDEICQALYKHCQVGNDLDKAIRLGNMLLLLSPIFDTATNFVESHHEVQFFDLWQLDSLLLQFLKNKV